MLVDKVTHEEREVDVLIAANAANYMIAIGLEVVDHSRRAGTPWVENMRAKHANLPVDKLVLVSKRGFTKPALVKARFYGIETLTIERALVTDWPLLAALETTGIFEITSLHYDCAAVCRYPDGTREQIVAPLPAPLQVGKHTVTVGQFANTLLNRPEFRDALVPLMKDRSDRSLWLSFTDPSGIWKLDDDGGRTQIDEMRIGLRVLRSETPVEFASGSYQGTPFVAGAAVTSPSPLQFVLARREDGTGRGLLVDGAGLRTLACTGSATLGNET